MAVDPFSPAIDLAAAVRRREVTAEALCQATLTRIEAVDPTINAFRHVATEAALERARQLDRAPEPVGPLHGLPVALKDNIVTRGAPTTAGSRILASYRSPVDATVVERLERAGAVIIGKTTCDEFAMGSSTEHSAFGPTANPWDVSRIPGGSSGGSAAAVASGLVPVALGSDTGGSIRQPAALCGVVGFKPTYGRVSRYGLIAFASSLDQIGPFGRAVADVALMVDVIGGHDPRDATSATRQPAAAAGPLRTDLRNVRIGVPRGLIESGVDAEVATAFEAALDACVTLGATVTDISLTHARYAVPVYYLIATAEASSNLARYDGVRYGERAPDVASLEALYASSRSAGFGPEVKRRLMLGTYVLSAGYYDAYYVKAQQVRQLIRQDYDAAFAAVDVVALPTAPAPAARLGELTADPLSMYLADVFTVGPSLAGLPAISVPAGLTRERLPIGLQLVGPAWGDETVLHVAHAYEAVGGWQAERPTI